jgi:hypothetical protein
MLEEKLKKEIDETEDVEPYFDLLKDKYGYLYWEA